ncbi:MAG: DUF3391 domain-containing protein, partial [Pseudomonas sp.]|nr:DUF3391 domain-containing protein [Pseudomonas sp.]
MLKKIAVEQSTTGMFVHQFCGSWVDHPFWSKQLLIADDVTLGKLRSSGIRDIIIDTERGVDVAGVASLAVNSLAVNSAGVTSLEESPVDEAPREPSQSTAPSPPPSHDITELATAPARHGVSDELERARELVARGKRDVILMFADARMGRVIAREGLESLV